MQIDGYIWPCGQNLPHELRIERNGEGLARKWRIKFVTSSRTQILEGAHGFTSPFPVPRNVLNFDCFTLFLRCSTVSFVLSIIYPNLVRLLSASHPARPNQTKSIQFFTLYTALSGADRPVLGCLAGVLLLSGDLLQCFRQCCFIIRITLWNRSARGREISELWSVWFLCSIGKFNRERITCWIIGNQVFLLLTYLHDTGRNLRLDVFWVFVLFFT